MLSYTAIRELAQDAARAAQDAGTRPASTADPEFLHKLLTDTLEVPFLGEYVPEGWVKSDLDDLFVDSSGWGSPGEPALTLDAFKEKLAGYAKTGDTYGFGVSQAGQFQVYVSIYRPDPRDFTRTGTLTAGELNRIRRQS
jgi:hypothetical protein